MANANLNPWTESKIDTKNPDRSHSLTIDHGWQEVARTALGFLRRFTPAKPS